MTSRRAWLTAVLLLAGIEMLLLVAQYLSGLWTNLYAPAMFTSSSSFASLNAHYDVGYVLFLIAVVLLILAALTRDWRVILGGLVVAAAVLSAGEFGRAYVNSSPNNPIDSFGMGTMFLVALFANSAVLMLASRARSASGAAPTSAAVPATPA